MTEISARYVGPREDGKYTLRIPCKETWEVKENGQTYVQGCPLEVRYALTKDQLDQYLADGTGDWVDDWARDPLCEYHQPE